MDRPYVGIGVMIIKDGKILLGKRAGSHGAGEYSFPGGHLENMESFEDCARREAREEAGVEIENVRLTVLTQVKAYPPKHFVQIGLTVDWKSGEPQVREPEKCEMWGWYELDNLPSPLFAGVESHIESYKSGVVYKDF